MLLARGAGIFVWLEPVAGVSRRRVEMRARAACIGRFRLEGFVGTFEMECLLLG